LPDTRQSKSKSQRSGGGIRRKYDAGTALGMLGTEIHDEVGVEGFFQNISE